VLTKGAIGLDISLNYVSKVSLFDVPHDYHLIGVYDTIKHVFIPEMVFKQLQRSLSVLRYDYKKKMCTLH